MFESKSTEEQAFEWIKQDLLYAPETGLFTWVSGWRGRPAGRIAGRPDKDGYTVLQVRGKTIKAHRLAWLYAHGAWPRSEIDHINGVRDDNRIANLRDVDRMTNTQNTRGPRKDSSTGVMGVVKRPYGAFSASIRADGKQRHLGTFKTLEEASHAYQSAKKTLHKGYANV